MAHGAIEWVEIPAKDFAKSTSFYESVFGWKINRQHDWEKYPMFMDAADKMGGGFVKSDNPVQGGVLLYVTVDEIDAVAPLIEKNGGSITKPKTLIDESVGWWATFHDPAGNQLGLYQKKPRS
jgi:predicted enzyme related to lactoylglutathione lyase